MPADSDDAELENDDPDEILVDAETEVIDLAGDDEGSGPAQMVVAPPKRPNMPSMMPGVVTGPTGQAPGG